MSELTEVLAAIEALDKRGEPMSLATIVATRGSTYRRAGARLLIPADGEPIGNLSGGCLEGDVVKIGREVLRDGSARMITFDLSAEGEEVWGYGLGCNGTLELLIEPADGAVATAQALRMAVEEERPCVLVSVIASDVPEVPIGRRLLVTEDQTVGSIDQGTDAEAIKLAGDALAHGHEQSHRPELQLGDGMLRLFVEPMLPPLRLVVCGAGHDAIPVVAAASAVGWRVVVADPRRRLLNPGRFPGATAFVQVEPAQAAGEIRPDRRTAVVVMTHNYLRDSEYLAGFLGSDAFYIGQLGPARRTKRLLMELAAQGIAPKADALATLHAPAGLDLGAEAPEEIAVAIVAEVLAAHRRRQGGSLRERSGPIHDRRQTEA